MRTGNIFFYDILTMQVDTSQKYQQNTCKGNLCVFHKFHNMCCSYPNIQLFFEIQIILLKMKDTYILECTANVLILCKQ